jgi:hypothetical protein
MRAEAGREKEKSTSWLGKIGLVLGGASKR